MNGPKIEHKGEVKYLGVMLTLDSELSWKPYTNARVTAKGQLIKLLNETAKQKNY